MAMKIERVFMPYLFIQLEWRDHQFYLAFFGISVFTFCKTSVELNEVIECMCKIGNKVNYI